MSSVKTVGLIVWNFLLVYIWGLMGFRIPCQEAALYELSCSLNVSYKESVMFDPLTWMDDGIWWWCEFSGGVVGFMFICCIFVGGSMDSNNVERWNWFMVGVAHKVFDVLLQIMDYSFGSWLSNFLNFGHCLHLYLIQYYFHRGTELLSQSTFKLFNGW